MMLRGLAILCLITAASACATIPAHPVPASISYETGPCFGRCPVYRVTVRADLTGTFEGRRFTQVTGTREFRVSPDAWHAFIARLAPLRPRGARSVTPGHAECAPVATDMPSATVRWSGSSQDRLDFYYGCRNPANQATAEALRAAPGLLPIGDFIGSAG